MESFMGDAAISVQYIRADMKRNKGTFFVGVLTVFIVVAFMTFIYNIIDMSPVIFLKFSENQVGEYDLILEPSGTAIMSGMMMGEGRRGWGEERESERKLLNIKKDRGGGGEDRREVREEEERGGERQLQGQDNPIGQSVDIDFGNASLATLNLTSIAALLSDVDDVSGCAPRWITLGKVSLKDDNTTYGSAMIMVMDTAKEREYGIGRFWKHRVLGEREIHASASLLRQLGVSANMGERVQVSLAGLSLLASLFSDPTQLKKDAFPLFREAINGIAFPVVVNNAALSSALGLPPPPPTAASQNTTIVVNGTQVPDNAVQSLSDAFVDNLIETAKNNPEEILSVEVSVVDGVSDPAGKWPPALGNVVVFEAKHVPKILNSLIPQNPYLAQLVLQRLGISPAQWKDLTHFPIEEYSQMIVAGYSRRFTAYMKEGEALTNEMIEFTNKVSLALGVNYSASLSLPLYQSIKTVQLLRYFLDQVFFGTLFVMSGLAVMLVYSLMLSDVDEKTYEFGMLRAIGFKHRSLVLLLSLQSLCFAVPGVVFGLLFAALLSYPFQEYIADLTMTPMRVGIATVPLVTGAMLGMLVPFVANIIPIRRALGRALRDSLDLYHQTSDEVTVTFVRLETLGLSAWQVYVALVMTSAGFTVYYLIPLCFAYMKIGYFLAILAGILIVMVIGEGMLGTIVQPGLEQLFLWCMLWGDDTKLGPLVTKSLGAHRSRNMKTGLMFMISLAFIIFTGVNMTLQTRSIQDTSSVFLGGDVLLYGISATRTKIDEMCVRDVLDREMEKGTASLVKDYTLVTPRLSSQVKDIDYRENGFSYDTLAEIQDPFLQMYGVERTYLDATYSEFCLVGDKVEGIAYDNEPISGQPDVIKGMYESEEVVYDLDSLVGFGNETTPFILTGSAFAPLSYRSPKETYTQYLDALVSYSTKEFYGTNINTPMSLIVQNRNGLLNTRYLVKPRAYLKKLAGFYFSSYRDATWGSPMLVTMDQYYDVLKELTGVYASYLVSRNKSDEAVALAVPQIRFKKLMLKLRSQEREDIDFVLNSLRNCITDDLQKLYDTNEIMEGTQIATDLILSFLYVTTFVQSFLCFFLLWFSFAANVKENSWEFGVLRAVGLSSKQVVRVYIYEALCLILSSEFLGVVIGTFTSVSLTLEGTLFTEMPFIFEFPWALFVTVSIISVVVSLASSYLATYELQRKQIAIALRGK